MRVRGVLVLGVLAGVVACSGETVPAPADVEPTGPMHGKVLTERGMPVTDADVRLSQLSMKDVVGNGVAIMSLGIFCLAPGICDPPVRAELSSNGSYVFPEHVLEDVGNFAISAARPDGADGLAGARTTVQGQRPRQLPDLTMWEPALDIDRRGDEVTVKWPALEKPEHGRDVEYTVWARDYGRTSTPRRVTGSTNHTSATLDLRPYEDQPTEVTVIAGTKISVGQGPELTMAYQSPGRELPSAGPPPSRDRPCLTDDVSAKASGELVSVHDSCDFTDGELDSAEGVVAETDCSTEPTDHEAVSVENCESATHGTVCVDLGDRDRGRDRVGLVVVRTPWASRDHDLLVGLSDDGRTFDPVGRSTSEQRLAVVPVEPARSAKLVCLRGEFSGGMLEELSVWP